MLLVISPAKTLDTESQYQTSHSFPAFLEDAAIINKKLKSLSKKKLGELMNLSTQLTELNHERNENWSLPFTPDNAKTAIHTFLGDVYQSLNVQDFTEDDLEFAQQHLRILSGLYGVLRPLDLIQPYRLEMGTKLKIRRRSNLYHFWSDKIAKHLNTVFDEQGNFEPILINLASNEYFKAIDTQSLKVPVITIHFKEQRGDTFQMIGFLAKKARGSMARFIIKNQITTSDAIQSFQDDGYEYNETLSNTTEWVFTR